MTSVNDLGDQAAVLRRARWLRSSRSRRQGAAASRSRSPEQSGLHGMFGAASGVSQSVGSVESEEELPDYESDEEVTVGQHAVNNLGEVAASQESAMIPPPAGHFQEGQESRSVVSTPLLLAVGRTKLLQPSDLLSGHLWIPDWPLTVVL
jgi:hypothetical protein